MKCSFFAKVLAFVVAALIAVPTVQMDAAGVDKGKSTRTTKTSKSRTTYRTEKWRQMVDKPKTTTTTKSSSKKSSNSYNSFSTSSYSSGSTTTTTDNTNRKIFLQNQIIDWKAKLKKAEKSYEECIASGEETPDKMRVVESKRKTIDECLEMIRTYEKELNSLK